MGRGSSGVATPVGSLIKPSGHDDSTVIQAAINYADAQGGGEVLLDSGTFLATGLVMRSNVALRGRGIKMTTLQLADDSDTDLIVTEDFATLTGGATQGGPSGFEISDLTLDGNRAGNASGWPLRIYGYNYGLENFAIVDGKDGGLYSEWGTGGSDMEARIRHFQIVDCEGVNLDFSGPHDSKFSDGEINRTGALASETSDMVHLHGNAYSAEFGNIHSWGPCTNMWNVECVAYFFNCTSDGSSGIGLWARASGIQWIGGSIYGTQGVGPGGTEVAIKMGSAADGQFVGQVKVDTYIFNYVTGDVLVVWDSAGYCEVRFQHHASGGNTPTIVSGSIDGDSMLWMHTDMSNAKSTGSRFQIGSRAPLRLLGGISVPRTAPSSWPYSVLFTDTLVAVDSSSARTVNLPAASTFYAGQLLIVKDRVGSAGANNITIARAGSDTIDGASSLTISTNYGVARLISDGTSKWEVV